MKKIALLYLSICFIMSIAAHVLAEDQDKAKVDESIKARYENPPGFRPDYPPWMEEKQVGIVGMVLPEGGKVRKIGAFYQMEGTYEYTARSLEEVRARLKEMEARQNNIEKEIDELKKLVSQLQKESGKP